MMVSNVLLNVGGMTRQMKMLDVCCGAGGVSLGFAKQGFEVTGIDIVDSPKRFGYPFKFIQADITKLDGSLFKGYDVIWASPPCRDFTRIAEMYGHNWHKNPPDPQGGLLKVTACLDFVCRAQPKYWILENVFNLTKYLPLKPDLVTYLTLCKNGQGKKHAFWGDFPAGLIPKDCTKQISFHKKQSDGQYWMRAKNNGGSWENSKIPLAVSEAFARDCKEALLEVPTLDTVESSNPKP
jgi:site-specific DNA-cytosine methylase